MLEALADHGVRYVLVGGFAALYHGAAHLTFDIDITPDPDPGNLERLSSALRALDARIRTRDGDEPLTFSHDGRSLGNATVWNLRTPHGDLDITFTPSGTHGYADLTRDATVTDVLGIRVEVASLADVIRSKEAAGRPKDLQALPTLRALLELLEDRRRGGG